MVGPQFNIMAPAARCVPGFLNLYLVLTMEDTSPGLVLKPQSPRFEANMAQTWLRYCLTNHSHCLNRKGANFSPIRLLSIMTDKAKGAYTVRLFEASESFQYVALSHIWGKFHLLTTTRATY
jgi:hypothetical protein